MNDKNKNLENSPAKNDKKNNLPEFLLYPDNGDLHYYYKFNKKMIMDTADISNLKHQIETERAQALNIKAANDGGNSYINHLPCLKMNAIAHTEESKMNMIITAALATWLERPGTGQRRK